jgi:hypothetical protein
MAAAAGACQQGVQCCSALTQSVWAQQQVLHGPHGEGA